MEAPLIHFICLEGYRKITGQVKKKNGAGALERLNNSSAEDLISVIEDRGLAWA